MATSWTIIAHKVQLPRSLGRVWTCFGRGMMSQSGHGQQLAFFAPTITKGTRYHEVPQHPALPFPQAKSLRTTHLVSGAVPFDQGYSQERAGGFPTAQAVLLGNADTYCCLS